MSLFKKNSSSENSARERDKKRESSSKKAKRKEKTKKEQRIIKRTTLQTLPYERLEYQTKHPDFLSEEPKIISEIKERISRENTNNTNSIGGR